MAQQVSQDALSISLTQIWQTLLVEEHQLLIELSVFRGGFTWEAAQSVADVSLEAFPLLVEKQYIVLENGRDIVKCCGSLVEGSLHKCI